MYEVLPMDAVQGKQRARTTISPHQTQSFARYVYAHWDELSSGTPIAEQKLKASLELSIPALSRTKFNTPAHIENPYQWLPVYEDMQIHAGLLVLPEHGFIPMHDHPHTIGITLVIKGNPNIVQADSGTSLPHHRRRLSPGEISFTFPSKRNIHGYESRLGSAALLSINIIKHRDIRQTRHWHFSLNALDHLLHNNSGSATLSLITAALFTLHSVNASNCNLLSTQQQIAAQNFSKAASLLELCADDGVAVAQNRLGDLYYNGIGVQQDYYTAAQWYKKAAKQGIVDAQYLYGLMLVEGNGVTDDPDEGFDWIFKAMMAGHAEAKLAYEYLLANPAPLDC